MPRPASWHQAGAVLAEGRVWGVVVQARPGLMLNSLRVYTSSLALAVGPTGRPQNKDTIVWRTMARHIKFSSYRTETQQMTSPRTQYSGLTGRT